MMNTGVMDELTKNNKPALILFWLPAKYCVSQVGEGRMLFLPGCGRGGEGGYAQLVQCELTWEER